MAVNRHMVKGVTKLRKIAKFQSSLEKPIKMLFNRKEIEQQQQQLLCQTTLLFNLLKLYAD